MCIVAVEHCYKHHRDVWCILRIRTSARYGSDSPVAGLTFGAPNIVYLIGFVFSLWPPLVHQRTTLPLTLVMCVICTRVHEYCHKMWQQSL